MNLYLMQHGDALPKEADPDRPLSERGRLDVERIAAALGRAGIHVGRIVHSGKLRAAQTAAIMDAALGVFGGVEAVPGIDPQDSTAAFAGTVEAWSEDTLVIGHLPFMTRLVARLVCGDELVAAVAYQPGTVICLQSLGSPRWSVQWMLRPDLLARGAWEES